MSSYKIIAGHALISRWNVAESDKKIHNIASPDKVKQFLGKKVTITGSLKDDGSLTVESVARSK